MLGYVLDRDLQHAINRSQWRNHWDVYIEEICRFLGTTATPLSLPDVEDAATLRCLSVLVVGRQSGEHLSEAARATLRAWVEAGGTLIGFAVPGLDDVFGIERQGIVHQGATSLVSDTDAAQRRRVQDDYAVGGYLQLRQHPLCEGIHSSMAPEQRLLAVSDVVLLAPDGDAVLADLYGPDGAAADRPAITFSRYGQGHAAYFAFDVAQTVWLLHQGRPIAGTYADDPYTRSWQLQLLGDNSRQVAYADELCFLLQSLIGQAGVPFIHPVPPLGEDVADALFYWGGDCGPAGPEMVAASDFMKAHGLPYHINVRPHHEPEGLLDRIVHVRGNGHEVSIYYEVDPQRGLVEELLLWQSDYAYEHYGYRPGSSVCGPCTWAGWAEPARWLVRAGNKADNSFIMTSGPLSDPKMNDSYYGTGFGTFYPFFFYDDYRHDNERIDLIEQQITWYELGHHGSIGDRESVNTTDVRAAVDQAARYHHCTNVFYHPWYIANFPHCREAIEEILRYAGEKGYRIVHMGNDAAADWWRARARSRVTDVAAGDGGISYRAACQHLGGMVTKVFIGGHEVASASVDGRPSGFETQHEVGGSWAYVVVPAGSHGVEVIFA
ncbi:MAG: hypothetical protein ACYC5O_13690 [Anaerolineae bacterium]